jgi:hypothetical protein
MCEEEGSAKEEGEKFSLGKRQNLIADSSPPNCLALFALIAFGKCFSMKRRRMAVEFIFLIFNPQLCLVEEEEVLDFISLFLFRSFQRFDGFAAFYCQVNAAHDLSVNWKKRLHRRDLC